VIRISTKGRYATRIMICLARFGVKAPARKQDIARAEDISADYVEQILMKLKAAGLVRSHRGTRGGFSLARDPAEISVSAVLAAVEGPFELAPCASAECARASVCVTRGLWRRGSEALEAVFGSATVAALAEEARAADAAQGHMFEI